MWGKNKTVGIVVSPHSHDAGSADRSLEAESRPDRSSLGEVAVSRVILLGEVLVHREALARALHAYDDVTLISSVGDVNSALILAGERSPDVLIVDSPSDAVAQALAAHPLECKIVFIGPVGECCRQLESRGAAIFVGVSSSLEEVHVALRFVKPRRVALRLPPRLGGGADSILTVREQEVSHLVAGGFSNKEIASACGISVATVKNHVHHILGKLNVRRRTQLAGVAADRPLTVPRKPTAAFAAASAQGVDHVDVHQNLNLNRC